MIYRSKYLRPNAHENWLKSKTSTGNGLKYFLAGVALLVHSLVLLALPANGATNASVTLAWAPIADPNVAGYNLYYGGASRTYTNKVSVGNAANATIPNLIEGNTYYFALTTYNNAGIESPLSNEAAYKIPVIAPGNLPVLGAPVYSKTLNRLTISISGLPGSKCAVEASSDLVNWVRVTTNTVPFTFVQPNTDQFVKRFFRAVKLP